MTDIGELRKSIEGRLRELRKEQDALESALSALGGATPGGRRRPGRPAGRSTTTARRGGRRRGRRGARAEQAARLVKQNPGITIPQMAKRMGIAPPYLYRVMPKLAQEGKVRKKGTGWEPVA